MNIAKILAVALAVFGEVEGDLRDGKLTVDEILDVGKTVVDKLGYGDKPIITTNALTGTPTNAPAK